MTALILIGLKYTPRLILLHTSIEKIISQKRNEWRNRNCEIHFSLSPQAKFSWIDLAPSQLHCVLSNLLNNAYEALTTKGEIFITLNLIHGLLRLKIHDHGCGIAPEKIPLVLAGKSFKEGGTGLGLSGAKVFMENLGGKKSLFKNKLSLLAAGSYPKHLLGLCR